MSCQDFVAPYSRIYPFVYLGCQFLIAATKCFQSKYPVQTTGNMNLIPRFSLSHNTLMG